MKKFYLLLSTLCLVASASAVEKEMASSVSSIDKGGEIQVSNSYVKDLTAKAYKLNASERPKVATRAGEADYAYFRAADNVMAASLSSAGYGWSNPIGFASNYGNIVFNNYSSNLKSNVWNYGWYSKDGTDMISVTDTDLAIAPLLGREMVDLSMNVEFNSGFSGVYAAPAVDYICGGGLSFWGLEEGSHDDIYGLTFYQNSCYTPDGAAGFGTTEGAYKPGVANYNAGGAYVGNTSGSWQSTFNQYFEGQTVSDIALDSYYVLQPKPASTYFMTTGWIWMNVAATEETQLMSYIYPIDENGNINEDAPLALGFAPIPKGSSTMVQFYYNPLNEDGDELDGEIFIDSAVAVSIEGFQGNNAITSLNVISGYMPFDYEVYHAGNYDLCKESTLRIIFSMNVDGEPVMMNAGLNGLYGTSEDPNSNIVTSVYPQFAMDATFAYILSADGENTVALPVEGGNVDFAIDALYYVTGDMVEAGYYEFEAPDWITVTVGEPDKQNGISYINIASAAGENRSGIVTVKGFGVSLDITVSQGESGVSVVKAEKGADYYDLAGRRVVNPEKGVYVKVNGNKTEKVIL